MNTRVNSPSAPLHAQRGVALAVALIILVITTLIALSASRFTVLELKQATNFETVREAQQSSQSVVDTIIGNRDNLPVTGGVGYSVCINSPGHTSDCDEYATLPPSVFAAEISKGQVSGRGTRQSPLLGPPPRGTGASLAKFSAARFNVSGRYDRTEDRLSRSDVDQGVIVLVPRY